MAAPLYPGDKFTTDRRLAWVRSRSQAWYRNEQWELTFEEYCTFFNSANRFYNRSRRSNGIVLTRLDSKKAWSTSNCCIITRINQLRANRASMAGQDDKSFYKDAIFYGQ